MNRRVNIGCGKTPIQGWNNYDNSISLYLAKMPRVTFILAKLGLLLTPQSEFISFAKESNIKWANAVKHIPEADNSVDVLYSSHMLEHLDKEEAKSFLKEALRILTHNGIIRIAVPDIECNVKNYLKNGDADNFIESTNLTRKKPKALIDKIKYLIVGGRNHQWMYDGNSLCKLLLSVGFKNPHVVKAGSTMISNPGNLNLSERMPGSVFVEAIKP